MSVAILGGTGPQGRGLALRFARAGIPVVIGSRDGERAQSVAEELNGQLNDAAAITGEDLRGAVTTADEMVILAVPYSAHDATLEGIRDLLPGKILIDIVVPLADGDPKKWICPLLAQLLKLLRPSWVMTSP